MTDLKWIKYSIWSESKFDMCLDNDRHLQRTNPQKANRISKLNSFVYVRMYDLKLGYKSQTTCLPYFSKQKLYTLFYFGQGLGVTQTSP